MRVGTVTVAVVAAAIAVFAMENWTETKIRFLMWTFDGLPLAAVILVSLAAGVVIVGLPLLVRSYRWRARARGLETRVKTLEEAAQERAAADRAAADRAAAERAAANRSVGQPAPAQPDVQAAKNPTA
jgi:uncharacterized integral membrane protein